MFLSARNPRLFSDHVVQHSVSFDESGMVDDRPWCALPGTFARAVPKRRVEFMAGRWCARVALERRWPNLADCSVGIGMNGEPLWPPDVVGTITHSHGYASAALARSARIGGLGVDSELVMDDGRAASLASTVVSPGEFATLGCGTDWPKALIVTFAFSAKESLFKCLYPEARRCFDFRDVEITEIDVDTLCFTARLLVSLAKSLPAGLSLSGRYERIGARVCTGVLLER